MPPPQPLALPLEESVKVVPSKAVALVTDPPPLVPVTYVAKAPISNSFGLKYDTGGGGGATTSFEETSGPANADIVCSSVIPAKAITLFMLTLLQKLHSDRLLSFGTIV